MWRRALALSLTLHGLGFALLIAAEPRDEAPRVDPTSPRHVAPIDPPSAGSSPAESVPIPFVRLIPTPMPLSEPPAAERPPRNDAPRPRRAASPRPAAPTAPEPLPEDADPPTPTVRHTDGAVLGDAAYATWYRGLVDQLRALPDARSPRDGWWRVRVELDAAGALIAVHATQAPPGVDADPLVRATLALGALAAPPAGWVDGHVEVELRWRASPSP